MNTQFQIHNLKKAIEILTAAPESRIDLLHYARATECGTLFCALGWLGRIPYFRSLGLSMQLSEENQGNTEVTFTILLNRERPSGSKFDENLDAIFGPESWASLFTCRGDSIYDNDLSLSDKEMALHRLRCQIARIKTRQRVAELLSVE